MYLRHSLLSDLPVKSFRMDDILTDNNPNSHQTTSVDPSKKASNLHDFQYLSRILQANPIFGQILFNGEYFVFNCPNPN
jgi:hypothetical protein